MGKMDTKQFIEKARSVHGDKYDYSKVEYVNSLTKVIIVCPDHGEFEQRPSNHLNGAGCFKCGKKKMWETRNSQSIGFVEKARLVHGDKYDYSKVEYVDAHTKIIIICPHHGEFEQTPNGHLNGRSCQICGGDKRATTKTYSLTHFIEKARLVHGDKYDYSKSVYLKGRIPLIIGCPTHGEFEQNGEAHLSGNGCLKCAHDEMSLKRRSSTDEFIEKANIIHNNFYDYSKVEYGINGRIPVTIICHTHGEFEQSPETHLSGNGCLLCGRERINDSSRLTKEEFIEKARLTHGDMYDYSKVEYISTKTKVTIICPIHGEFEQAPGNHLSGNGCPSCSHRVSAGEQEVIDFIRSITDRDVLTSTRPDFMDGLELDIYIPHFNVAIEYDGLHYHSELHREKEYHLEKTVLCENVDVHLIHIFEDEWLYKKEIVKSRLKNLFGITEHKLFARKCKIVDLSNHRDSVNHFLNNNHIQGSFSGFNYVYGLLCDVGGIDQLVSVMTFNDPRTGIGADVETKDAYELSRFCSLLDYNVIGGASRLLKHFIKLFDPVLITSYADRRWSYSKSNVYEKLGFPNKTINGIGYSYIVNGTQRRHRSSFTKTKLMEKYGCLPEDTEHNFCYNNGFYRIYDCGTITYKMMRL